MLRKFVLSLVSCGALNIGCALPSMDNSLGSKPSTAGAAGKSGASSSQAGEAAIDHGGNSQGGIGGDAGTISVGAAGIAGGAEAASAAGASAVAGGSNVAAGANSVAGASSAVAGANSLSVAGASGSTTGVNGGGVAAGTTSSTAQVVAGASGTGSVSAGGAATGGVAGATAGGASALITSPPPGCEGELSFVGYLDAAVRAEVTAGSLTWAKVKDLSELSVTCNIDKGQKVLALTGIECLTGLQKLSITDCQLKDISALGKSVLETPRRVMPLTELFLWGNAVADITPVTALENLASLSLRDNYIGNGATLSLIPLASLPKLQSFDGYNAQIESIRGLENHPSLTGLELSSNNLTSVAGLGRLPHLTTLYLDQNQLVSADGLGALPAITELHLRNQGWVEPSLRSIDELASLATLAKLDLGYNQKVASIASISTLTRLTELDASVCGLSNTVALKQLTNLIKLILTGNQLTDITELAGLIRLDYLDLSENVTLTNIASLADNTGLTGSGDEVDLDSIGLSDLSACRNAASTLLTLSKRGVTLSYVGCTL
jgi:Leucine-rich repeat (LRR) protein